MIKLRVEWKQCESGMSGDFLFAGIEKNSRKVLCCPTFWEFCENVGTEWILEC